MLVKNIGPEEKNEFQKNYWIGGEEESQVLRDLANGKEYQPISG